MRCAGPCFSYNYLCICTLYVYLYVRIIFIVMQIIQMQTYASLNEEFKVLQISALTNFLVIPCQVISHL